MENLSFNIVSFVVLLADEADSATVVVLTTTLYLSVFLWLNLEFVGNGFSPMYS